MGVSTSNDATPETMSNNIKSIARDASSIRYDNSSSTLTSTNVQGAVDEINDSLEQLVANSQKIECGINTVSFNNSTDSLGRTINFKKSYTKVPIVITSTGHTGVNISAGSITTNGFIAYGRTIRGNSLNESTVFSYIVIEAE